MPSLADVFVQVAGEFGPLRQGAETQGAQAGQDAARTFGDKFKAGLNVAGAAGGAVLMAGLVGAISRTNTTGLLAAQVGASGPQMAKLGAVSGKLYADNFGNSVEEVNDALRAIIQNGLATVNTAESDLEALGARVTTLTGLLGEDANRVAAAIQQMLRTGLADSAEEAFDILTQATQGGINKSEDLLDTLNEYSTQFRQLGLDGPQALGLISQALKAGARDSDTVADSLKEFAIRAQDGSKLSADAFKALGIDAQKAFDDVAAGGPRAAGVLDTVLDRLRAMPPSAERTALAVALFGTKAEDLQDSLYALDLTGAAAEFGNFEGAAGRATDTLGGTAASQVESFKRSITEGLINAVAKAIPTLQSMWAFLVRNQDVIGPLVAVIASLAAVVWTVNAAVTAWAAITAAANAVHLVTFARIVANNVQLAIYLVRIAAIRTATIIWTGVQWLLNAALIGNPIGIVVVAIAALVAAIVLAYKNSETFRNIVQAVWKGIQVAAQFAWENILKPIFSAIVEYVKFVGGIYLWLWREVVQPAWTGISTIIQVAWTLIKIYLGALELYIKVVIAPLFLWLYNNIIKPVWAGIVATIQGAWALIKAIYEAIKFYIERVLAPIYQWLWDRLKIIWTGIKDTIVGVWTQFIRPTLDAVGGFITNTVVPAFQRGVQAIGSAWDALKELARKPVAFVVNTVINPLVRGYNAVATKFGGTKVDEIQGFAHGGHFDGQLPGPPSDVDNMLARGPGGRVLALASGEYVTNARSTAKWLPLLTAINADRFADGGFLDWIKNPIETAKKAFGGPLNRLAEIGDTPLGQWISNMPRKLFDSMVDGLKKLLTFDESGGFKNISGGGIGGSAGMMRILRAVFPGLTLLSGYRPGSRTLSGSLSYHAQDRAVDVPPIEAVARWIRQMLWPNTRELITPWQQYNLHNGRPHTYTGAVWNQHNFAGGNAHIHWAYRLGGLLGMFGRPQVYDGGGILPPGGVGINLSNRSEVVASAPTMEDVVALLGRLIDAVERVAPGVVRGLDGVASSALQKGRAR